MEQPSKNTQPNTDPRSKAKVEIIGLFLANCPEDCEIVKCLDVKTGELCDVLFIPALDPNDSVLYMTPAFPIPESDIATQLSRYIPVNKLDNTSPLNYKNN
jgi:hypothetical protein